MDRRSARMLGRMGGTRLFLRSLLARQALVVRHLIPAELFYRDLADGSRREIHLSRPTTVQMDVQLDIHFLRKLEQRAQFAPLAMRRSREASAIRFGTSLTRLVEHFQRHEQLPVSESMQTRGAPAPTPTPETSSATIPTLRVERAVRPVERVMRKSPGQAPASDQAGGDGQMAQAGSRHESAASSTLHTRRGAEGPIPLSSTELSRLTEQVIHTIDRRFVAYRERHGG